MKELSGHDSSHVLFELVWHREPGRNKTFSKIVWNAVCMGLNENNLEATLDRLDRLLDPARQLIGSQSPPLLELFEEHCNILRFRLFKWLSSRFSMSQCS